MIPNTKNSKNLSINSKVVNYLVSLYLIILLHAFIQPIKYFNFYLNNNMCYLHQYTKYIFLFNITNNLYIYIYVYIGLFILTSQLTNFHHLFVSFMNVYYIFLCSSPIVMYSCIPDNIITKFNKIR